MRAPGPSRTRKTRKHRKAQLRALRPAGLSVEPLGSLQGSALLPFQVSAHLSPRDQSWHHSRVLVLGEPLEALWGLSSVWVFQSTKLNVMKARSKRAGRCCLSTVTPPTRSMQQKLLSRRLAHVISPQKERQDPRIRPASTRNLPISPRMIRSLVILWTRMLQSRTVMLSARREKQSNARQN